MSFRQSRFAAYVVSALVLVALYCALTFLLKQHDRSPHGDEYGCERNLYSVCRAVEAYTAKHGYPPPVWVCAKDGTRICSWRIMLLPYLKEKALWMKCCSTDSWREKNNEFGRLMPDVYRCPVDKSPLGVTSYVGIGVMQADASKAEVATPREIGIAGPKLIAVIEVANSGIPWTEPQDFVIEQGATPDEVRRQIQARSGHFRGEAGHILLLNGRDSIRQWHRGYDAVDILFEGR